MNTSMIDFTMLRLRDVLRLCGKSRSTWYADIASGLAPRPVSLGKRAVGWPASELQALNKARIAGKGNKEIRRLVDQLHAARRQDSVPDHTEREANTGRGRVATPISPMSGPRRLGRSRDSKIGVTPSVAPGRTKRRETGAASASEESVGAA